VVFNYHNYPLNLQKQQAVKMEYRQAKQFCIIILQIVCASQFTHVKTH